MYGGNPIMNELGNEKYAADLLPTNSFAGCQHTSFESEQDVMTSSSRFRVARVDSQSGKRSNEHEISPNGTESPSGAMFSIGTNSVTNSSIHKTCGWSNTHEAFPREDHYRNLFSAPLGLRSRPTLAELHEEIEEAGIKNRELLLPVANDTDKAPVESDIEAVVAGGHKFGWFKGVYVRCILNIFGVMLFLRMPWVVGQAGFLASLSIVALSTVVTCTTTLSMSAICTNGEVKGGGAYFLISRSLGAEFGFPIGMIFSMANAVAVSMYTVGAGETVVYILLDHGIQIFTIQNDIRIVSVLILSILAAIGLCGMKWESRAQLFLLMTLVVSMGNFFVGVLLPASDVKMAHGFSGIRGATFFSNLMYDFRYTESYASVFAIFFPAATGILAGANISGDLQEPGRSIPKGTFAAIFTSSWVYMLVILALSCAVLRESNGLMPSDIASAFDAVHVNTPTLNSSDYNLSNVTAVHLIKITTQSDDLRSAVNLTALLSSNITSSAEFVVNSDNAARCFFATAGCHYGLYHDYQLMSLVSAFSPLVTVGIFSATLSSALASLISAPKVFQAVCNDRIVQKLNYFAETVGPDSFPRRAYILTVLIASGFCVLGDLNLIAPMISMFFLATYALINFACLDSSLAESPGWRPGFKYYNKYTSLLGFLSCLLIMFLISWYFALACVCIVSACFMWVKYSKPDVNWGSSTQAHVYRNVLKYSLKLLNTDDHIKNYRPQFLVLTGNPENRPAIVDFVSNITKNVSLMVCGNIIIGSQSDHLDELKESAAYRFLKARKAKAFYKCCTAPNFRAGVESLLQNVGIGKFKPDILLMGFKNSWQSDKPQSVLDYFMVIHDAFDLNCGVGILRVKEGLGMGLDLGDATIFKDPRRADSEDDEVHSNAGSLEALDAGSLEALDADPDAVVIGMKPMGNGGIRTAEGTSTNSLVTAHDTLSSAAADTGAGDCETVSSADSHWRKYVEGSHVSEADPHSDHGTAPKNYAALGIRRTRGVRSPAINTDVIRVVNQFHMRKMPQRGTIDVWWMHDDGGLTVLVPHLMKVKAWKKCRLRIFVPSKKGELNRTQRELVLLVKKLRLDAEAIEAIHDIMNAPCDESMNTFNKYLEPWLLQEDLGETKEQFPWKSTPAEVQTLIEKTKRQVRLREKMLQMSSEACLIVTTLPMPRKGGCSAGLYMCWIDTLTRDMPPTLLLRGNQESVLTFYS